MGGSISGEIIEEADGVVVGDKVVENATGFSHREYGLAVRKSIKGFEVHLAGGSIACEDVVTAGADGAFLAACYRDKHTSIYLTSFAGIVSHEDAYMARPVKALLGFQSGSVVFEDGRSLIIYQDRLADVGMPVEAIAFFEGTFYCYSNGWIVSIDVHSMDVRPAIKVDNVKFSGFLEKLPVFHDGRSFYVLDGGSLVRRGSAVGGVSAWKNLVAIDSGERLVITDPYSKVLAEIPKDPSARCIATKYGVICFRENMLGIVDYSSGSLVEAYPIDSEDHAITVSADTTLYIIYKDSRYRVSSQKAVITDKEASVLREHVFDLTVSHLLGDEYLFVRSPTKKVEVAIENARLYTSSAMHKCGGLGILKMKASIRKPDRVSVEVMGRPIAEEVCLDVLPDEVLVEAVDTVAGDRIAVAKLKPAVELVEEPKTALNIKHYDNKSMISLTSDVVISYARLCCSRVCRDIPINGTATRIEVDDCRLPAWVEVEVEREGFLFRKKFEVDAPALIDEVFRALNTNMSREYRLGGFHTYIPVIDYPDIPPIHRVSARVLPDKIELQFNSRVIGRGLLVAGGRVRSFPVKNGENILEVPFSHKMFLVIDAGRKWLYSMELKPEALIRIADKHARLLKHALGL